MVSTLLPRFRRLRPVSLLVAALALCGSLAPASGQNPSPSGFGTARPLTSGWLFQLADDTASASPACDDSRWQRVAVPHDWSVRLPMSPDRGSCQGYLPGGIGWYRLHLSPADLPAAGRRLYVYFEGVYNRSTVFLNGQPLGHRPSGFASFLYDLTPHLLPGQDNVLAVRVDHSRQDDSRWYTGSGIYRPAWLVEAPEAHFALWGTSWELKRIDAKQAVVEVALQTEGTSRSHTVAVDILDADGRVVASASPTRLTQPADGSAKIRLSLPRPRRWTLEDPYIYKVRARLREKGQTVDVSEVPLGLRTLEFSPDRGFALNGEWMKVKGVCLHDDAGVLGTAVPPAVWRRRLLTLKQLGTNAVRMSHNPHSPALYALCDSLGLLVMDEASDEWEFPKRKWLKGWNQGTPGFEGTSDFFEEWIDRDVADMVRRDRCHPSVFLWSIGNEVDYPNDPYSHPVLDRGGSDFTQPMYGGYKPGQPDAARISHIAQRLARVVRSIDPSRAVTGALAGVVMSNETAYPEAVDVVGYNYTESRYTEDHLRYPGRVIYGSENRHDLPSWLAVRDNGHIFGQFLWTGIDYLGESGPWPARGSEAGLLDLAGQVKPLGHYRASLWATQPVCYVGTYPSGGSRRTYRGREQRERVSPYAPALWNYEDGRPVRVVCYTNGGSARLLLCPEGADASSAASFRPVGGEPTRDASTGILYWDIDFHAGTLRCEADNGSSAEVVTCGRPFALRAEADVPALGAGDVAHVTIEVVDEHGRLVPLADNAVTCRVLGGGRLLGLENGDIRDTGDKTSATRRAHGGRLVAYVARQQGAGQQDSPRDGRRDVRVAVSSPLLGSAEVSFGVEN